MNTTILKESEVELDPEVLKQLQCETANYTIVHCKYVNLFSGEERIRIWPTTYLIQENGIRKKLLFAYNIAFYPEWKTIEDPVYKFTLLFEGLDKDCLVFDLFEDIPESGEFFVPRIARNRTDVYVVAIE